MADDNKNDDEIDGPDKATWPHGPISQPIDRYAHLPAETRAFLEHLRKEDIKSLSDAVRFYKTAVAVGRFNAWLIAGIFGVIVAFVTLGDAIRKLLGWAK